MDLIFGCAKFTVTAAAGSDETMDLPRIRSVLSRPQPSATIRGMHLVTDIEMVYWRLDLPRSHPF